MCRVQITIAIHGMLRPPLCFGISFFTEFHTAAIGLFSIIEFHMTKVMLIATLAMK